MRDGSDLCPVCREVMDGVFEEYGGPLPEEVPPDGDEDPIDPDRNDPEPNDACPAELRDDGVCDRCLGDDPDCTPPRELAPMGCSLVPGIDRPLPFALSVALSLVWICLLRGRRNSGS